MTSFLKTILGAVAAFAFAAPAIASPITYTEVGIGNGTLDGVSFSDQLITITMTADTSNITGGPPMFRNSGTTTVTVSNTGTDTLTNAFVFVNQVFSPPAAGFGDTVAMTSILDTLNSAFASYALNVAIGPTSGAAFFSGNTVATGSGTFRITFTDDITTFTATGGASVVPLPAALPLFATGLALLGLLGWRRKRKAA